jgi:hypothetical protein
MPHRDATTGLFAVRQIILDSTENIAHGFAGLLERIQTRFQHFGKATIRIYKIIPVVWHTIQPYTKFLYSSTLVEYKIRKNKSNIQISK